MRTEGCGWQRKSGLGGLGKATTPVILGSRLAGDREERGGAHTTFAPSLLQPTLALGSHWCHCIRGLSCPVTGKGLLKSPLPAHYIAQGIHPDAPDIQPGTRGGSVIGNASHVLSMALSTSYPMLVLPRGIVPGLPVASLVHTRGIHRHCDICTCVYLVTLSCLPGSGPNTRHKSIKRRNSRWHKQSCQTGDMFSAQIEHLGNAQTCGSLALSSLVASLVAQAHSSLTQLFGTLTPNQPGTIHAYSMRVMALLCFEFT